MKWKGGRQSGRVEDYSKVPGRMLMGKPTSEISTAVRAYEATKELENLVTLPAKTQNDVYDGYVRSEQRKDVIRKMGYEPNTNSVFSPNPKAPLQASSALSSLPMRGRKLDYTD